MRTITFEIYKFDELSPEAQAKAILNNCNINIEDYNWWEPIYEDANEIFLRIDSFDLDRKTISACVNWVGKRITYKQIANKILITHGKNTDTYKAAEIFLNKLGPVEVELSICETERVKNKRSIIITEFMYKLKSCYTRILQKEYDYLQSDEAVKETLIANEYEFYSDGTYYHERKLK